MKSLFVDAVVHELRRMGFSHKEDAEELSSELDELRRRIRGLEDRLERLGEGK
jgi:polyhydroxyalkanoate synthesis regulator phasin